MKVFCKNSKRFTLLTTWPGGKKWKSFTIFAKKAPPCTFDRVLITPVFVDYKEDPTKFTQLKHFCIYYNESEHGVINNTLSQENKKSLRLVSAIFYQILILLQMITLQKLWKMFFISSKKLFSFSRYSNVCNLFPSIPHFADSKGQMEVE